MKAKRLKALGFALLGSLALLFAGCGQQAQAPQPGQPTTVAVEGVYDSNTTTPVDPNNVAGLVIVRAKVALGSVVPDKVQFLLDDRVEYEVSFGVATQGLRPQQATYTFEWNLNTAGLDGTTPKYPNGAHSVKVRLMKGTSAVATSTATNLVFKNQDFIVLKLSGNAINKGGNRYYGGGPVSMEVVPVLYSGKQVASVRLDMPPVDLDDAAPGVQSTKTLTAAPYVFTIPYNTTNRNTLALNGATFFYTNPDPYTYFTVTYTDTTTLSSSEFAVLDGTQVLVDTTGLFSNNPVFASDFGKIRLDYYVAPLTGSAIACRGNTQFLVDGQFANDANLRAGLSSLTLDAGVGGDTLVLDVKTTTGVTVLADVSVPLTGAGCLDAGALSGLGEGGFYRVFAKAVKDALGNSRTFSPPSSSVAFGIDTTKPTLALGTGRDSRAYFNSASLNTGSLSGQDLNGNAVGPTITAGAGWLNVNDPTSGTPPVASGVNPNGYIWTVNGQTIASVTDNRIPGLNDISAALGSAPQGYYTLTLRATDNAGNASDPVTLLVLYDNVAPNVVFTQPSSPALTGGAAFTATASATDNVDLLQGRIFWSYGNIRFEAYSSSQKAFGAPVQSTVAYSTSLTALKPAAGNFSLFAWVRDQARNAPATASLGLTVTPANANTAGSVSGVTETPDISGPGGGSTTLTITHSGGTATVKAVHVYLWESNDGTNDYYKFVGDAVSLGGGQYAIVVTAPAGLSTYQVLVVVEYDNGLASGYTYDYDTNTLSAPVF
jgi:hypothetical protein